MEQVLSIEVRRETTTRELKDYAAETARSIVIRC